MTAHDLFEDGALLIYEGKKKEEECFKRLHIFQKDFAQFSCQTLMVMFYEACFI